MRSLTRLVAFGGVFIVASALAVADVRSELTGSGSAAPVSQARTAAKAQPIVVRDFRFVGFDKDVVGRGWNTGPNGERDAHFSFMLATPNGARRWNSDVMLQRCNPGDKLSTGGCIGPDGKKPYGLLPLAETFLSWNTKKPPPAWARPDAVLAVFLSGKRVNVKRGNPRTWLTLPRSAKGVRVDLYVNDGPGCIQSSPAEAKQDPPACNDSAGSRDHRFAPGQSFRLMIMGSFPPTGAALLDRERYGPWLTLPGPTATSSTPPVALGGLSFHGLDQDVVGRTLGSPPDGVPDAHFSIELTMPRGPGYLWGVHLTRAVTDRSGPLPQYWYSNGGTWSSGIAVSADGKRLTIENPNTCDPSQGCNSPPATKNWLDLRWSTKPLRLDLYASGHLPGAFSTGQRFQVEIYVWPPELSGAQTWTGTSAESEWLTLPGV